MKQVVAERRRLLVAMTAGKTLTLAGTIATAPIIIAQAIEEIESGDPYLQLKGGMGATGVVVPPAAVLSAYTDIFVEPAARSLNEAAVSSICSQVPCP